MQLLLTNLQEFRRISPTASPKSQPHEEWYANRWHQNIL